MCGSSIPVNCAVILYVALLTVSINPRVCSSKLKSYMSEFGSSYPWTIGGYFV